jgi:hypothetical protein
MQLVMRLSMRNKLQESLLAQGDIALYDYINPLFLPVNTRSGASRVEVCWPKYFVSNRQYGRSVIEFSLE